MQQRKMLPARRSWQRRRWKRQQRQRIILIESDEEVSEFLMNELKDNYDVTLCETGKKGIAAIGTKNPDMVISDVKLYDMEGQAICSRIKGNSSLSHIPVILLTNNDPNIDRLELLEAAADAYIMRPFNMDILQRTIVNLLHRQEMLKLKFGRKDQLEEMVDDIRMKSPDEKLMERIMAFINDNLSNMEISNEDIADSDVGIALDRAQETDDHLRRGGSHADDGQADDEFADSEFTGDGGGSVDKPVGTEHDKGETDKEKDNLKGQCH